MRRLYGYLTPYTARIAIAMLIKLFGTAGELMLPKLLQTIIDDVVPTADIPLVLLWGGAMVVCSILCVIGNILANRKAAAVSRDVTRTLRHDLFSKICYLSSAQTDRATVPSLVSRLTTDTYNVHQMVGMVQRMGVRAPILLIGGILVTLTQDGTLTLLLLATMPLIGVSVTLISKKGIPLFAKLQASLDGLVRIVRENVSGARVIKALSKSEYEVTRFATQSRRVADDNVRANTVMSLSSPFVTIFLNLGLVAVLIVGAGRVQSGLTKPGVIVAFLSYFTLIANGMLGLTRIFVVVSRASASANRIQEILDLPEDLAVRDDIQARAGEIHVEFDDVTFSYNKRKPTLEHISFQLKRGQSLGVIGATGSGKSTILMLLMRFYDADEGAIRIGGRDVKTIPPDEIHTMFGVTFQNDVVYSDTALENLKLGRDISDEDVARAIITAQASFLTDMEEGLQTHLNAKGTNLSGGQRQRLLVARALAGKPDILLLDDASSALDYRTDADMRMALKTEYANATRVIVASRVSSIANCDEILVLNDGNVIGQGTHEALLETCDEYRQIAETQMGGMR